MLVFNKNQDRPDPMLYSIRIVAQYKKEAAYIAARKAQQNLPGLKNSLSEIRAVQEWKNAVYAVHTALKNGYSLPAGVTADQIDSVEDLSK